MKFQSSHITFYRKMELLQHSERNIENIKISAKNPRDQNNLFSVMQQTF